MIFDEGLYTATPGAKANMGRTLSPITDNICHYQCVLPAHAHRCSTSGVWLRNGCHKLDANPVELTSDSHLHIVPLCCMNGSSVIKGSSETTWLNKRPPDKTASTR